MQQDSTSDSKGRILLVDDEPYILGVLEEVLKDDGYTVECAPDAESALAAFNKNPFHLVITDIRLGGRIDGLALLQHFKKNHPDIQFIIITSFGSPDIREKSLHLGAHDFITKPFDDIDIISTSVQNVFDKINLITKNK